MKTGLTAVSGTTDKSDCLITVEEAKDTQADPEIIVCSNVICEYGEAIERTVRQVLRQFNVRGVRVTVSDRGALDFVIRARMETAIFRMKGIDSVPWRNL